ncbi:hypothetical protein [uncultured Brachyspira sp.]|uniref:hypothetical protein n=1 Tax=uncultured Brachyspira sp. TaxID=221953 RepID=UPI002593FA39|nr:hypothetical protein [uncultured Brachyspira sp.]
MKHTKNILKSLLITVMALSLLSVSCSKDEGGSKPTSPQTVVVDAAKMTEVLSSIFSSATGGYFAQDTTLTPASGNATVGLKSGKSIDEGLKTALKNSIQAITEGYASVIKLTTSNVDSLSTSAKTLTLTMEPANANVKFASNVTDKSKYNYDASTGKATLVVTIQ